MNLWEAHAWAQTEEGLRAARYFLEWPKRAENRLTLLYAKADHLREKIRPAYCIRETTGSSGRKDKVGELAVRLADIERETEALLHALSKALKRRQQMIDAVEMEDLRQALRYHYLEHMTCTAAAMRMYIDERQYFRKLRQGCIQIALQLAQQSDWMAGMESLGLLQGKQNNWP